MKEETAVSMVGEYPESVYKTAYYLDKDLNVYTRTVPNRRVAVRIAEEGGYEFIGFLKEAVEDAEIVNERRRAALQKTEN